jgi:putative membrane protein
MFESGTAGQDARSARFPSFSATPVGEDIGGRPPREEKASMITLTRGVTTAAAVSVAGLMLGASLLTGLPAAGAATVQVSAGTVSAQDTTWAQSNAQTDLAEIAIGQLAEQRAQHAATKSMAQMTISDHQKALSQLKTVASQAGITLPTAPNATQQAQAAQLKSVSASQFDATYDSDQVQGHKLSISQTNTEIASGSSTAVKNFARVYLPVAEKHLQMAESDYAQLSGSASGAPGVAAGTGGMAATGTADDAPWLAFGAAGMLLLAGTAAFGLRRRLAGRQV